MMRYQSVLLLVLGLSACGDSMTPQATPQCAAWEEGKMLGGTLSDQVLDLLIDPQGNLYLAGYENGITGATSVEPAGEARGMVARYRPGGELQAKMTVASSGASTVEALALHPQSGELFLTGRTNGAISGYSNNGQYDLLLGRVDSDGQRLQLAQWGGGRPEHPVRLEFGWGYQLIVAGYEDIYIPTNYLAALENPLLATFTWQGNGFINDWSHLYRTSSADAYQGLVVARDSDGGIYVTGHKEGSSDRGMFVTKFDSQGIEIWSTRLTQILYDNGAALVVLEDGNLLLAGSTFALLGEEASGQMDIVLIKLNGLDGEVLWVSQYGSSETDWVSDMAVDEQGQAYVVGESMGVLEAGATNSDMNAVFLVKFDAQGEVLLARQWNSGASEIVTTVAVDACEQAFIGGYTRGDLVGPSNGGMDGFVLPVVTQ